MKVTPRQPDDRVNAPRHNHLREMLNLFGAALLILGVAYLVLGFVIQLIVPYIPLSVEEKLGGLFYPSFCGDDAGADRERLKGILAKMVDAADDERVKQYRWKVCVVDNAEVNASALAGGHIVFNSGLMDEADSDAELAFVLGHEMGHVVHRDHLHAMGRSLGLLGLSVMLSGHDSSLTDQVLDSLDQVELFYSRDQERAADLFGMNLAARAYGHAGGAIDFMARIEEKSHRGLLSHFFSTHPLPSVRMAYLQREMEVKGYKY